MTLIIAGLLGGDAPVRGDGVHGRRGPDRRRSAHHDERETGTNTLPVMFDHN